MLDTRDEFSSEQPAVETEARDSSATPAPAGTGAAAEQPKKHTLWQRFVVSAKRLEQPFVAIGKLGGVALLVSALGWFVTSLIGYNSWRTDRDLKQYEDELTQATRTFTEASDAFSKALTTQQLLVFNYVDALNSRDQGYVEFLWEQAHTTAQEEYRKARIDLRETIGTLARRAEIYIDWPSAKNASIIASGTLKDPLTIVKVDAVAKEAFSRFKEPEPDRSRPDTLTVSSVEGDDIDCDKLIAVGDHVESWPHDQPVKAGANTKVDWSSTKHHLIVLYACFSQDHVASEPVRRWAAQEKTGQPPSIPMLFPADKNGKELALKFKKHFNLQTQRLDKFSVLAMTQIGKIRSKNETPGYICHTIGWFCGEQGRAVFAQKPST